MSNGIIKQIISLSGTEKVTGSISAPQEITGTIATPQEIAGTIATATINASMLIDDKLSETSSNPVMNKIIYKALQEYASKINSFSIGTTETVPSDENASVINSGTDKDIILNFKIPRGKDGTTISIGENGNWFIDNVDSGYSAGLSPELTNLFSNNKFAHTLTIGEHVYDGTQDVIIGIYNGEVSEEEVISSLSQNQAILLNSDIVENNNNNMVQQEDNSNVFQLNNRNDEISQLSTDSSSLSLDKTLQLNNNNLSLFSSETKQLDNVNEN